MSRPRTDLANLEFEETARLRDELKRLKLLDLEFANEVLTAEGEAVDRSAPNQLRAEAAAEKAQRFRKMRWRWPIHLDQVKFCHMSLVTPLHLICRIRYILFSRI